MHIEIEDLVAYGVLLIAVAGQFFHLKGRLTVVEARQKDDRESVKEGFREIKSSLQRIEDKIDEKADK